MDLLEARLRKYLSLEEVVKDLATETTSSETDAMEMVGKLLMENKKISLSYKDENVDAENAGMHLLGMAASPEEFTWDNTPIHLGRPSLGTHRNYLLREFQISKEDVTKLLIEADLPVPRRWSEGDETTDQKNKTSGEDAGTSIPSCTHVFKKSNEKIWEIGPVGGTQHFVDIKGFSYIQFLLRNPNRQFSFNELIANIDKPEDPQRSRTHTDASMDHEEFPSRGTISAGLELEVADPEAIAKYRSRLHDLSAKIEKLKGSQNPEDELQRRELEGEKQFLVKALQEDFYAKKRRGRGPEEEKQRSRISRNIDRACAKIIDKIPAMTQLLGKDRWTQGYEFSYHPHPSDSPFWDLK